MELGSEMKRRGERQRKPSVSDGAGWRREAGMFGSLAVPLCDDSKTEPTPQYKGSLRRRAPCGKRGMMASGG